MGDLDRRLLLVAPTGRDSELLKRVLAEYGLFASVCPNVADACESAREGAAALLLAEEALEPDDLVMLQRMLHAQPEWSDLPVLMLVTGGSETAEGRKRARDRENLQLNNLTLLERPIRMASLVSSVRMAMRSRVRQYEMRDSLQQRATAEEAVRRSEKLAVAGRLAASIAHEINNPLESVTNLLYLIGRSETIDEVRAFTRTAEQELARVSEIVTQTLRFHRQQSKPIEVSMREIFESVLSLYGARIAAAGVTVCKRFRGPDVQHVRAGEIRQLIANLVQNALDAMPQGGTLTLKIRPVRRSWKDGSSGVKLVVADSGLGIPVAIRKTLFEPFVTTKGATGTGLGLWVSKGIVLKHGGEFRFRSRVGKEPCGTIFTIFLPSRRVAEDEVETTPRMESSRMASDAMESDGMESEGVMESAGMESSVEALQAAD